MHEENTNVAETAAQVRKEIIISFYDDSFLNAFCVYG
jgi:hypothetical protein